MNCPECGSPAVRVADPPSANGFEFTLWKCPAGHQAMHCWCVASSTGAMEPITPEDAAVIVAGTHPDLPGFMKAWQAKTIGA